MGILATHTLMAGTFTLIADPLRYIMGAYDAVTGAAKPHDYTNDLRNMMSDEFGPELGGFLARGAGEVAGAEWYRRIGLSNLLEMPELKSFDKAGVFEMMATALFGASGEDAATMAGGLMKGMGGDVHGMLMATVPRLLRDPMKAYGLATEGAKTQAGKTVLTPDKLSTSDIAYQAAGFTPTRVDEARTARYAIEQRQEELKNARSKLTQAFVAADADGRSSAMTNIRAFNADPANRGMTITTGELMQALQAKRKAAAQAVVRPGTFGLALPKKASNTLQQEGRFANVQ